MKLADYLKKNKIERQDFALTVKISSGYVTHLCNGDFWPSRKVVKRIEKATKGKVRANDFV
jgi:hypothetical protein